MTNGMALLRGFLMGILSAVALAACVAHGQQTSQAGVAAPANAVLADPHKKMTAKKVLPRVKFQGLEKRPYWRVFRSYSSHSSAFFKEFLFGRVFVHAHRNDLALVSAEVVHDDGRTSLCAAWSGRGGKYHSTETGNLVIGVHSTGASRDVTAQGKLHTALMFYDPETGVMEVGGLLFNRDEDSRRWSIRRTGWVQESWPRAMAEACPDIQLPDGMRINEKQTSRKLAALLRQDPSAPIRSFPGSEHTGPGRVSLVPTEGGPTTTNEEIAAFMEANEGNIMLSATEKPYVFSGGWREGKTEIWRLAPVGVILGYGTAERITDPTGQEWSVSTIQGLKHKVYYPVGWPLPLLPTGYRHAAFQITDRLIEAGAPVVLPWMPAEWKDFTFRADGTVRARRADGGPDRISDWHWTEGRLWVVLDGNREAPGWEDVVDLLGLEPPTVWTLDDVTKVER